MVKVKREDTESGSYKSAWRCQLCGYYSVQKCHCVEHMLRKHCKPENVRCEFCGKAYKNRPNLRVHKIKCSKRDFEAELLSGSTQ